MKTYEITDIWLGLKLAMDNFILLYGLSLIVVVTMILLFNYNFVVVWSCWFVFHITGNSRNFDLF